MRQLEAQGEIGGRSRVRILEIMHRLAPPGAMSPNPASAPSLRTVNVRKR